MDPNIPPPAVPPVPAEPTPPPPIQPPKRSPILPALLVLLVLLFGSTAYLAYQNMQQTHQIAQLQKPILLPAPTASLTPTGDLANWKTYSSSCGFSVKYPDGWNSKKFFIQDSTNSCAFLTAPDYKQGSDTRSGFSITFTRLLKGGINQDTPYKTAINTTDDYIKSIESLEQPLVHVKNKLSATYGSITGTQFNYDTFESTTTFVFLQNNYFWIINWPTTSQYNGQYRGSLDQILSTFKFLSVDETAGWIDTTTNTAFISGIPYSFKYPPTAVIGGAGDFTTITVNGSEIRFGYYGKQGDVNTLMSNYQPFTAPGPVKFTNKQSVSLNGLSGYKATATNSTATYYFLASQTQPTKVILFTFTAGDTAAGNLLLKIIGTIQAN